METISLHENIFNSELNLEKHEYQPKQGIAGHIKWITNPDRSFISKVGAAALVALEFLALTLSLVGIYYIFRGVSEYIKLKKVEAFEKMEKTPPPSLQELQLIHKKFTFNHTNYFVIHEGVIWTKPIHEETAGWTPIFYDGKPPVELQADGANLIVIDEDRRVHYKKVIKEWRDVEDDHYCYADKCTKNNWKSKWFSLPVFHFIANVFTGKLLKLPEDSRAWAISHRSAFNNYQTDAIDQKHVEPVGTTQLYVLNAGGKSISIYDPWIHKSAKIEIPVPNSSTSTFEAVNISASSSTIMLIGYETTDAGDGKLKRELKVYTWFVDVDILGWNPGVKYDYPGNNPSPKARVIPMPGYMEHPLNLPDEVTVTNNIKIIQNGEGNDSRILVVEGTNTQGETGYYWKQITDTSWTFKENSHEVGASLAHEDIIEGEFVPEVRDYVGKINDVDVTLEDYGKQNYLFKLKLEKDGETVEVVLNKRKTLITLLGMDMHKYEIALPAEISPKMEETVRRLFGDKKVIKARLSEGDNSEITLSANKFSLKLSPV